MQGRVEFRDVDFSYDPKRPLIEGLSIVAEPGETIAIVGPTGAGKTTLVNLIMRFYELDGGSILLDGRDTAQMPRSELRSHIGMVLQDTWLFGGTIRDNIAYGRPDATDDEVLDAAKACYVDRFVHSLPDGYDTVINEEGDNISAGEKQLITIARAFLADRSILILDEATSSVDTRTEVLVQVAMNKLRTNRTSFVIAHRLSTIRGADVILVMENGKIVEQGDHDELLERDGPYARLYNSQFQAAIVDDVDVNQGEAAVRSCPERARIDCSFVRAGQARARMVPTTSRRSRASARCRWPGTPARPAAQRGRLVGLAQLCQQERRVQLGGGHRGDVARGGRHLLDGEWAVAGGDPAREAGDVDGEPRPRVSGRGCHRSGRGSAPRRSRPRRSPSRRPRSRS